MWYTTELFVKPRESIPSSARGPLTRVPVRSPVEEIEFRRRRLLVKNIFFYRLAPCMHATMLHTQYSSLIFISDWVRSRLSIDFFFSKGLLTCSCFLISIYHTTPHSIPKVIFWVKLKAVGSRFHSLRRRTLPTRTRKVKAINIFLMLQEIDEEKVKKKQQPV